MPLLIVLSEFKQNTKTPHQALSPGEVFLFKI